MVCSCKTRVTEDVICLSHVLETDVHMCKTNSVYIHCVPRKLRYFLSSFGEHFYKQILKIVYFNASGQNELL
jgi:hypothetical protein